MDTALALHIAVPGAQYGGVPGTTEEEYALIVWNDYRQKPTWSELQLVDIATYLTKEQTREELQNFILTGYGKLIKQIVLKLNAARTAGVAIPAWDAYAVTLYNQLKAALDILNGD